MYICGNARHQAIKRKAEKKWIEKWKRDHWRKLPLGVRVRWNLYVLFMSIFRPDSLNELEEPSADYTFERLVKLSSGKFEPALERHGRPLTASSSEPFSTPDCLELSPPKSKAKRTEALENADLYIQQTECPLFTKLPFDLRRMIYIAALGERVIHFIDWPSKYQPYTTCAKAGYGYHWSSLHYCWHLTNHGIICAVPDAAMPVTDIFGQKKPISASGKQSMTLALGLVMTCRQIYSESINLLYSHNEFNIGGFSKFNHLQARLPTQRWNSIRSASVTSISISDWNTWLDLSFLKGLHTLRVRISLQLGDSTRADPVWEEQGALLLTAFEPIMKIDWPRVFEIAIPLLEQRHLDMLTEAYPGAPFKFITAHCSGELPPVE